MDILSVLFAFIQVYVVSFSLGYDLEFLSGWHFFEMDQIMIKTVLRTCLGITILIPVLYATSLVTVSSVAFQVLFWVSLCGVLGRIWYLKNQMPSLIKRLLTSRQNSVPLVIGIAIATYLARSVSDAQWPPPGDVEWVHGPLVALIDYYGKLPNSWAPLVNLPLHYPSGFHVVTAFFDAIWGVYPGQAVFIYGASLLPILVLLSYSTVSRITGSMVASIAGAASILYVGQSLVTWPVGYFYNGPYPNLLAFLIVAFFAGILAFEDTRKTKTNSGKMVLATGIACSLSLVLSYPPFALYTVVGTILALMIDWRRNQHTGSEKTAFARRLTIVVVILAVAVIVLRPTVDFSATLQYMLANPTDYSFSIQQMVTSWSGLLVLLAVAASIFGIAKRRVTRLDLQYLLIALPGLLFFLSTLFIVILPNRSLALAFILGPVVVLPLSKSIPRRVKDLGVRIGRRRVTLGVHAVSLLFLIICSPSLYLYATDSLDSHLLWYPRGVTFSNDFAAMKWIVNTVPQNDLILNDLSYAGLFLPSLRIQNLTFTPISANGNTGYTRAELYDVWQNPRGYSNPQGFNSTLSSWNVENPWSTGGIGKPIINQVGIQTRFSIPAGSNGQWGAYGSFAIPQNLTGLAGVTITLTTNRRLGLSLELSDSNNKTVRYDLISPGSPSSRFDFAIGQPTGMDQGFDFTHVESLLLRTGWIGPFPQAGDSVTVESVGVLRSTDEVQQLLSKYNVKWIWVTSEWGMVDILSLRGIPSYVAKPFSPGEYSRILQNYTFLAVAYSSGNSTIFKVNLNGG